MYERLENVFQPLFKQREYLHMEKGERYPMEMWFSDIHTDGVKLSIRIEEQLFSAQSEVQRIDVLESKDFGKILVVDGDLMLTERDEFIYHEMITHVPMAVHPGTHAESIYASAVFKLFSQLIGSSGKTAALCSSVC